MKVFLSHQMSGLSKEEVMEIRNTALNNLQNKFGAIELIDNYHHEDAPKEAGRLWHLGTSIRMMEQADLIYFCAGWKNAKGCLIERQICDIYGLNYEIEKENFKMLVTRKAVVTTNMFRVGDEITVNLKDLSRIYDTNIEIKVFTGGSSLRRKLTKCNNLQIATISSGLPLKGEDKMVNFKSVQNEKEIRMMIKKNLNKEIHGYTKPSIDFIFKILEDAYNNNIKYDVSDMRNAVLAFAANSSHSADKCIKIVNKMKFKSDECSESVNNDDAKLVFYDVEVFPNLFLVNWKFRGKNNSVVRMINPKPKEIEELMRFRLVGFNCRR